MGEAAQVDIGWLGLALSFLLVVVAVALSLRYRLRLEREMLWASARMLVQLLLVGLALELILDPDTPLAWSWVWVAGIIVFAAWTVSRRAREVPDAFLVSLVAIGLAGIVTLGVIFGLGIFPIDARYIVPTAGMMVGNSMKYTVLVAQRILDELDQGRDEVEARLALGLPWQAAARPHVRRAVRDAITPQVETTRTVGLVFLPGAMTGLILAGVSPLDAVLVQGAIMYLILGGVATTAVAVATGLARRLFTPDHRLLRLDTA
jgi:putative ABC transport system permease protein